jgi:preprotein translocase subunit SecF
MRLLKRKTSFDFMSLGNAAVIMSIILSILSIVVLAVRGLNFGLDFTGGTLIEVSYPAPPAVSDVRANLATAGLADAVVQTFGAAQ